MSADCEGLHWQAFALTPYSIQSIPGSALSRLFLGICDIVPTNATVTSDHGKCRRAFGTSPPGTLGLRGPRQAVAVPSLCWLPSGPPSLLFLFRISPAKVAGLRAPEGAHLPPPGLLLTFSRRTAASHWTELPAPREEKGQLERGPGCRGGPYTVAPGAESLRQPERRVGGAKEKRQIFTSSPAGVSGSLVTPECLVHRKDPLT